MTHYAIVYMVTMSAIIASIGYMQFIVAGMRHSLYHVVARIVLYGDHTAFKWLKRNSYYFWCILFQWASIGTVLTMIGQFMKDNIFVRPNFIFYCSAALWLSIFFVLRGLNNKK